MRDLNSGRCLAGFAGHELRKPVDGIKILRQQLGVIDFHAELFLEKHHQFQDSGGIDDALVQKGIIVSQGAFVAGEQCDSKAAQQGLHSVGAAAAENPRWGYAAAVQSNHSAAPRHGATKWRLPNPAPGSG